MVAPEKIYLQCCGDCPETDCDNCKFEDLEDNVTWCKDRIFQKDIEYTRTDVLIEKTLDFFENDLCCYIGAQDFTIDHKRLENDFKKAMKGE